MAESSAIAEGRRLHRVLQLRHARLARIHSILARCPWPLLCLSFPIAKAATLVFEQACELFAAIQETTHDTE
jgi:hypothetical protein